MSGEITIADPGEQARVLNILQMFENGAMGDTTYGATMQVLPLMCKTVIGVRKLNRKFINQLRERGWRAFEEGSYPKHDEEIVARLHDGHTVITHFLEEDIGEMQKEGIEYWLRIPKLSEE